MMRALHAQQQAAFYNVSQTAQQQMAFHNVTQVQIGNQAIQQSQIPPPKSLENAGMKVEDLIGWRIWTYRHGHIWAFSQDYAWMPGEIAEGTPGDYDHAGIWAFKEKRRAFQKAVSQSVDPHVWGSVRLWGHVVEHADGFRAAKARIVSIDGGVGIGPEQMAALCEAYGVPAPKMTAPVARQEKARADSRWVPGAKLHGEITPVPKEPGGRFPWPVVCTLLIMSALVGAFWWLQ